MALDRRLPLVEAVATQVKVFRIRLQFVHLVHPCSHPLVAVVRNICQLVGAEVLPHILPPVAPLADFYGRDHHSQEVQAQEVPLSLCSIQAKEQSHCTDLSVPQMEWDKNFALQDRRV